MAREVSCPVFVGRAAERARLRAALDDVGPERVRLVLVTGEAGVGKTRLVNEAIATARVRGTNVLEGACLPLGEALPYGPFVEMLGVDLFVGTGATDRLQLFREVADRLTERASGSPILVVVEDLHWADSSTCDLVVFCARLLGADRLLMVCTYRREQVPPGGSLGRLLGELAAAGWVEHIELGPFSRSETGELVVAMRGGTAPDDLIDRVHTRSGGNPFFAEELVAMGAFADELPETVRGVVLARLGRLDGAAREVASVVAVAGPRARHELVAAASELDPIAVDRAVAALVGTGLLVADVNGYGYRHALAHDAVLADLGAGERAATHRRVAELLTAGPDLASSSAPGAAAAERAHHWEEAGRPERALQDAMCAVAETDSRMAPAELLAHLDQILRLWGRVGDPGSIAGIEHSRVLEMAGDAALAAGDYERATELLEAARRELGPGRDPRRLASVVARLSLARRLGIHLEDATRLIEEAARIIPHEPPTPELAFVLARQANDWLSRNRVAGLVPFARRAVAVGRAVGSPVDEAVALIALGWGLVFTSGHDDAEGLAAFARAVELARQHGESGTWATITFHYAHVLQAVDRRDQALTVVLDTLRELGQLGAPPEQLSIVAASAAGVLTASGRLHESEQVLRRVDASSGLGDWYRTYRLIELCLLRDRLGEARAMFDDWVHRLGDWTLLGPYTAVVGVPLASAELRWEDARTRAVEGLRASVTGWPALPFPGYDLAVLIGVQGLRCEADRREAGAGDHRTAEIVAELASGVRAAHLAHHDRYGPPRGAIAAGNAAMAEAEGARAAGRDDPDCWRTALAAAEAAAQPCSVAYAQLRLGSALYSAGGSRGEASELLHSAHRMADAAGATALVRAVDSIAARVRVVLDDRPAGGPVGQAGLTPREAEVLALVAAGQSNREIADTLYISVKTASVHVTNILRKLGVTSRVHAASLALRSGDRPESSSRAGTSD